jgi:hypothetical protein
MTKQFLHHPKIRAGVKHMGGKCMTEPVGCYWPHQSQLSNCLIKEPRYGTGGQTPPKAVQEQGFMTCIIGCLALTP